MMHFCKFATTWNGKEFLKYVKIALLRNVSESYYFSPSSTAKIKFSLNRNQLSHLFETNNPNTNKYVGITRN